MEGLTRSIARGERGNTVFVFPSPLSHAPWRMLKEMVEFIRVHITVPGTHADISSACNIPPISHRHNQKFPDTLVRKQEL